MEISQRGLDFIKEFEGCYLTAYQDQAKIWTIGIGTIKYPDGTLVKKGDTCTLEQADRWLAFEVTEKSAYFNQLLGKINLNLEQCEYDALVSFLYNVGIGKCRQGTSMGDALLTKDKALIAKTFLIYCKYTRLGIKLTSKGLLRRRTAEMNLFIGKQ